MLTTATVQVPKRPVDAEKLSPFRFGPLADGYILTNDQGHWHHLDQGAFRRLLAGHLEPGHGQYDALVAKGFLRESTALDEVAANVRAAKRHVGSGPTHHRILLGDTHGPLTVETAKDILNLVMLSSSAALDIELIAPPGAWNQDIVAFIHQYTTEKNRYEGKALTWRLHADLTALPDGAAGWLIDKRFTVRTTLGAPDPAHVAALQAAAAAKGRSDNLLSADVPISRSTDPDALLDRLAALGIRRFRARPVLTGNDALSPSAWAAAYDALLAAVLGRDPASFVEETGAALLTRALRPDAPADIELRSPGGWGTGLLVYDAAGHLFPSLLAARLHAEGDDMFLLGRAGETSYKDCTSHPTLRALAVASLLECLPGFADHWATPFAGVDPIADYAATGDLFPKLPTSEAAAAVRAVAESIFRHLIAHGGEAGRLVGWIS